MNSPTFSENTKETRMITDFTTLLPDCLNTLLPYVPGKTIDALKQELGLTDIIKLGSNENPRGCSPLVIKQLGQLSGKQVSSYLVQNNLQLTRKISQTLNINQDWITLANGTDPLFPLFIQCFALHQHKHMITHQYAFQTYSVQAKTFNIPCIETPLLPDWNIDVNAIINACTPETAFIIFANPNNPTGSLLSEQKIKALLTSIPETTLLVIDEAYIDYLSDAEKPDTLSLLTKHANLILTRTFSKAYGLAGLRIGYAISHPNIAAILKKVMQPFTINIAALLAAETAMNDTSFIEETYQLNQAGRHKIFSQFNHLGIDILPAYGNFVTIDLKQDSLPIYQQLLQKGIIVRPLHAYNMPNHIRVTIGTPEQNQIWLAELRHIVG